MKAIMILVIGALIALSGCSGKIESPKKVVMQKSAAAGGVMCAMKSLDGSCSGTVKETLYAAGYTYARVTTDSGDQWAAAPRCTLKIGETISFNNGMPMANFESKTLKRTFPLVYFTVGFGRNGAPAVSGHSEMQQHGMGTKPAAIKDTLSFQNIVRPAGGNTIEDLFVQKKKLVGKKVVVRGRVAKANNGILGKNWLHIKDGTGGEGANDLTVTTDVTAGVGETVLVEGVLVADKDIGAGYVFPLIIENAKVTIEK